MSLCSDSANAPGLGELSAQRQGIKQRQYRDPEAISAVHQGSETGTTDEAGVGVDVSQVRPVRASGIRRRPCPSQGLMSQAF